MFEPVNPILGAGLVVGAALAFAIHVALHTRKAGGRWVGVMVVAPVAFVAEVLVERELDLGKPQWGYAIRILLVVGFLLALLQLARERARAR